MRKTGWIACFFLIVGSIPLVDEKLQREMITVAAQRVKAAPPAPERVFDFSFARKAGGTLR